MARLMPRTSQTPIYATSNVYNY